MSQSELVVREQSVSYGSGLYANRPFAAGELIASFGDAAPAAHSYLSVQIGRDQHVDVHFLRHLNHACRPNTVLDTGSRSVSASRDIAAGEMLTFFYPSTEWEMSRPFLCQCGAPECIGIVTGARRLAPAVLGRYFVNRHIRDAVRDELLQRALPPAVARPTIPARQITA